MKLFPWLFAITGALLLVVYLRRRKRWKTPADVRDALGLMAGTGTALAGANVPICVFGVGSGVGRSLFDLNPQVGVAALLGSLFVIWRAIESILKILEKPPQ